MDQTTDTLVLDTAWELPEHEQRFERQDPPQQSAAKTPHGDLRAAHLAKQQPQNIPAPSIGEKWIADAIRWVSARLRRNPR